jgi:hypothetical protein
MITILKIFVANFTDTDFWFNDSHCNILQCYKAMGGNSKCTLLQRNIIIFPYFYEKCVNIEVIRMLETMYHTFLNQEFQALNVVAKYFVLLLCTAIAHYLCRWQSLKGETERKRSSLHQLLLFFIRIVSVHATNHWTAAHVPLA